jgi:hypothetical protein
MRDRLLRREADQAVFRAQIGDLAQQAGLDLDIARRLDPASLLMWLAPTGEIDEPRLWLMAELLVLEALQARGAGGDGRSDLQRALAIYARLPQPWRPSDEFPTVAERAAEVRGWLHEAR